MALPWETDTSGGGTPAETWGDPYQDPLTGQIVQRSSRGNVRVIGDPAQTVPTGSDPRDLNGDGLDDQTGYAVGVYAVPTSVSPSGFIHGPTGKFVTPSGLEWTPGSGDTVPGYSNLTKGAGGIYGLNEQTGRFELIPGSENLGTAPTQSGPVGSGGGGGSNAYSSIATQMLSNQGALARIDAEAQAAAARDERQAAQRMQELLSQQNFTGGQNALQRALTAAQYAATHGLNRAQVQLQEKDYRRGLTRDFQDAVSSTDPSRYASLYLASGGNIGNIGDASAVSDRSLYGAAQILRELRAPGIEIPDFVWTENGPMPTTSGATGGTTGGTGLSTGAGGSTGGGASQIGSAMPFTAPNVDMTEIIAGLRAAGATDADIAQLQADIASGKRSAQDFMLSGYYKSLTGNPNFLRGGDLGPQMVGPLSSGSDRFYDTWQAVDPFGSNYNPAILPQQPVSPFGTGGVTASALGGGTRTGELDNRVVIPGYASGTQHGLARGLHIAGDPPPGSESPNPEMIRWTPQGNEIIPLRDMRQARGLMRRGMEGYALGTLSRATRDPYGVNTYTSPTTIPYSEPVQQPIPATTTGGSGVVQPSPTTTTPTQTTTPTPTQPVPAPPPVAAPSQPPVIPTDPLGTPTLPAAVTPEDQALMDEVRQLREGIDYPSLNIYDVGYFNLDPVVRDVFEKGRQVEKGIPQASTQFEAAKFRPRGLSRSQFAMAV